MTDDRCRRFFLDPTPTLQRRYEVLRAFFVEGRPQADIATQFGLATATVQSLVRDFRAAVQEGQPPPFFSSPGLVDRPGAGHLNPRSPTRRR